MSTARASRCESGTATADAAAALQRCNCAAKARRTAEGSEVLGGTRRVGVQGVYRGLVLVLVLPPGGAVRLLGLRRRLCADLSGGRVARHRPTAYADALHDARALTCACNGRRGEWSRRGSGGAVGAWTGAWHRLAHRQSQPPAAEGDKPGRQNGRAANKQAGGSRALLSAGDLVRISNRFLFVLLHPRQTGASNAYREMRQIHHAATRNACSTVHASCNMPPARIRRT